MQQGNVWTTFASVVEFLAPSLEAGSDHQDLIDNLIIRTSREIDEYLGYPNLSEGIEFTIFLNGSGTPLIVLPYRPVVVIYYIRVDASRNFGDDTILDTSGYYLNGERGDVFRLGGLVWDYGFGNIKIHGTSGWGTTYGDPPALIEQICIEIVAKRFQRRLNLAQASKTSQDGSVTLFEKDDFTPEQKRCLDMFRKWHC